jgi:hypothetical protein
VVRHTSNSAVAGLPMATAPLSSGWRMAVKFSAREHSALCGCVAGVWRVCGVCVWGGCEYVKTGAGWDERVMENHGEGQRQRDR